MIGNAAYEQEMGALQNARNDAEDMAKTLRKLGFHVTLLVDAGHESMEAALHAFLKQLRQQRGVGLFYFAGHGAELDGRGYLFPVRSGIRERWQLPYKAMHVSYIQAALEEAGNRMNMIVLDACRNIPTFEASAKTSRGITQPGLPPIKAGPDMVIAYATSPGQVALDGNERGRNGIYTKYLLQAMTMPGLSVEDVFRTTLGGVLEATQGKQRPWSSVSLAERFEFVPSPGPATQDAPRTEPPAKIATENRTERPKGSVRSKPGGPR